MDLQIDTKLKKIKLVISDVDGVLTDGGMYYNEEGEYMKKFNTRDSMGMELLLQKGIKTILMTRENSKIVKERVKKIKMVDLYSDVIKKYDSPTTYFYVDPPYWKTENYYSLHNFDRDDHEKLCNQLKNIEGKFSLSYYDFDLLGGWLPEDEYIWERKEFVKAASARKDGKQNKGEELLIMNQEIDQLQRNIQEKVAFELILMLLTVMIIILMMITILR